RPNWACLVWLEDRGLGGWPNPYGVDFTGLMKIPAAAAEATLARGAPARGGGGSTLAMQLARSILKDYPSRSDGLAEVLRRKYWEYTSAPVLTRMLAAGGDWTRFRRWTAMHFAHIQGVDRSDVFGVEAAGRVLFGKGAGALSTAEQYVLAGAIRQPIKFGSAAIWRRAGWGDGRRKGRGRICAEALLEGERRATVLAELEAMAEAGPPAPSASPRIAAYLEGLGKSDAVIGGPELRAARLLRGAQRGALAQARDEFGAFYRRDLEAVTLTLDAVANARFGDRVDRRLARPPAAWRRAIDWGAVTLDYGEARAAAEATGEGARPALTLLHVVLAAADEDGRIVRFYTNQFDTHYFGAVGKRRPDVVSVAEYQPERETREIASIGKLLAAAALGEAGRDTALSGFDNSCLRARAARCYCGGPPCRDDRAFVQARHVFGESLNDALIAQLTRRGLGARVGELAERAGLTPPPSAADEGVSPATLAVRGRYAATPRTVQRLAAALDGFAHRGDSGRAPTPTLIADAVLRPRAEPGRAPGADAAARPAAAG
ncbi:MAG: transglycosylase domain-containing protein, partial [Pseudomonadota bacterium]